MVLTDTLLIFDNLRQTLKVVATPYVRGPRRPRQAYDRAIAPDRRDRRAPARAAPTAARPLEPPAPGEDRDRRS